MRDSYTDNYYHNFSCKNIENRFLRNGYTFNGRPKRPISRITSYINSYSSDSDESFKDDLADITSNYHSSPQTQSSINCTPIPVQIIQSPNDKVDTGTKVDNSNDAEYTEKPLGDQILTPRPSRYRRIQKVKSVKREPPIREISYAELSTPDVTKKQVKDSKYNYSDQNIDSSYTSYVDSLFGVEPYKYVHEHQPLKLFWLENSEVSGLMRIPSLTSLSNEFSNSEKLYMVFTDYTIDIIQDVSCLKMIKARDGYTPFVVIYSYNLKSMYFKVVKRTMSEVSMVSFNKNSTDLDDCLSFDCANSQISSSDEQDSNYEFYRSYLYGKDDGTDPNRVRVLVHPSNKTHFDLRYLSVNPNSHREEMVDNKSMVKKENVEVKDEESDLESSNSDSPFSNTFQNGTQFNLPDDLFDECKLLVGVDVSNKGSSCPDSVANYRSESVIKKNYTVYIPENTLPLDQIDDMTNGNLSNTGDELGKGDEQLSKEFLLNLVKVRDEGNVLYRSGDMVLTEGQVLKIEFPTIYTKHFEYDYVTLYSDNTLKSCFNFIKSLLPEDCLNININKLAQFCPNIFWNLALAGDIETSIIELDPEMVKSLYRRKRTVTVDSEFRNGKTKITPNSLSYLDNNFIIMQNLFQRDAEEKIKKLLEIERQNGGKMTRIVINKHAEDDDLIKLLIDDNGFTRKSMQVLTEKQKNMVYNECMKRNFYVPVHIKFNPQKGRGVYAAYKIHKDDFLMEYKGELITEKVANFRNNKYNKSKKYKGSFIFFFKHNGTRYGIDATEEDISFGPARLVNHSRKNANIVPKTLLSNNYPRLIFIAKRDIECGEELLVDYGERDPSVIKDNPWLLD
ncbi:N-lysine methyltransferase SETD8-A [Theileria parva strain Muguga]|uniref:SET domain-containing protein n=1 Tax=Theileria parva TaxID=5875 RepID=Q4N933_THEPA|nr:N-lysine methyltransferase SETD8-A [Theileria parva strain Muguga]EAN33525.1 N-lysine methyltransferase SETD8-A [Theileria parva strain Muguga]|eukprot:XP_765808.1 hypothetical protein [Theileria parva strain Muguga]